MIKAVVDASVLISLAVDHPLAEASEAALRGIAVHAPRLLAAELSNGLRRYRETEALSQDGLEEALRRLIDRTIFMNDEELALEAVRLSRRLDHAVYDCLYIAAARKLYAPLITADLRLARKAAQLEGLQLQIVKQDTP